MRIDHLALLFVLLVILTHLTGCTVTHEWGHKPELRIDNPYADKTKLKLEDGGLVLKMEWYF